MPNYERLPKESGQARAGRIKREINQENDALGLQVGEWINYGGRIVRFRESHIDRICPAVLRRATPDEIAVAEAKELKHKQFQADSLKRQAWMEQPQVQAARSIHWAIESDIDAVIERLTPQEWIELAAKITGRAQ